MNIIGDIAGQYESFIKLIDKMPKQKTLLLGDLNDRGWDSNKVIQWAIDNDISNGGSVITLDSNHGDMFVDYVFSTIKKESYKPRYEYDIFLQHNGGNKTMSSYGFDISKNISSADILSNTMLLNHINWLSQRPSHYIETINNQKYFFSHAPVSPNTNFTLSQFLDKGNGFIETGTSYFDSEYSYQWNRYELDSFHKELPDTICIWGHNAGIDLRLICDQYINGIYIKGSEKLQALFDINKDKVYGICLDTSRDHKLCGLDLNKLEIYHERY